MSSERAEQGRCGTCAHWRPDPYLDDIYNGPIGNCAKLAGGDDGCGPDVLAFPCSYEDWGWLLTRPTFGCVMWEAKTNG